MPGYAMCSCRAPCQCALWQCIVVHSCIVLLLLLLLHLNQQRLTAASHALRQRAKQGRQRLAAQLLVRLRCHFLRGVARGSGHFPISWREGLPVGTHNTTAQAERGVAWPPMERELPPNALPLLLHPSCRLPQHHPRRTCRYRRRAAQSSASLAAALATFSQACHWPATSPATSPRPAVRGSSGQLRRTGSSGRMGAAAASNGRQAGWTAACLPARPWDAGSPFGHRRNTAALAFRPCCLPPRQAAGSCLGLGCQRQQAGTQLPGRSARPAAAPAPRALAPLQQLQQPAGVAQCGERAVLRRCVGCQLQSAVRCPQQLLLKLLCIGAMLQTRAGNEVRACKWGVRMGKPARERCMTRVLHASAGGDANKPNHKHPVLRSPLRLRPPLHPAAPA